MSAPLTYEKIEEGLRENINRMEHLTEDYANAIDAAANAEAEYKSGTAAARLRVKFQASGQKVTEQTADDKATVECKELLQDYLVKKAKAESAKQALLTCRDRRASLQSLMASHRAATG